jgi:hypothetical protein
MQFKMHLHERSHSLVEPALVLVMSAGLVKNVFGSWTTPFHCYFLEMERDFPKRDRRTSPCLNVTFM